MADRVSITAADGHRFDAWRADPSGDAKGGIIFLQAIYGLTTHLGDVCDWFARDGYAAIAPALYDRAEPNRVFGYDQEGMLGGMAFRENLAEETVLLDVSACANALRETAGKVAISGFCTGGTWAWICADALDLDAVVIFYGSNIHDNLHRRAKCPAILHYGDDDHIVPINEVQNIRATFGEAEFHIYPGCGHAFYNPEQAHHSADAAQTAHERSVVFLERHLAPTRRNLRQ